MHLYSEKLNKSELLSLKNMLTTAKHTPVFIRLLTGLQYKQSSNMPEVCKIAVERSKTKLKNKCI